MARYDVKLRSFVDDNSKTIWSPDLDAWVGASGVPYHDKTGVQDPATLPQDKLAVADHLANQAQSLWPASQSMRNNATVAMEGPPSSTPAPMIPGLNAPSTGVGPPPHAAVPQGPPPMLPSPGREPSMQMPTNPVPNATITPSPNAPGFGGFSSFLQGIAHGGTQY